MPDDHVVHVVEDDSAMRDALLLLLRSASLPARGYASAEEFLAEQDYRQSACLLVDVRLPGMSGLALQRELVLRGADPAIVMMTGHGDIPLAVTALKAGAMDFVTKPFDPAALLDSIREAWQRAAETRQRAAVAAEIDARLQTLSPREASILALLAEGRPSKIIAAELGISHRTVEHHRASIMEKMHVRSLSQLIRAVMGRIG
jgi:two-component system, LuxR family, response regulator FixJ